MGKLKHPTEAELKEWREASKSPTRWHGFYRKIVGSLLDYCEALRSQVAALEECSTDLSAQVSALTEERDSAQDEAENLAGDKDTEKKLADMFRSENQVLRSKLAEAEAERDALAVDVENEKTLVRVSEVRSDARAATIEALEKRWAALKEQDEYGFTDTEAIEREHPLPEQDNGK